MTLEEFDNYFSSRSNFQKKTGLSRQNVNNWRKMGYIPIVSQIRIERATEGALKASINDMGGKYGNNK